MKWINVILDWLWGRKFWLTGAALILGGFGVLSLFSGSFEVSVLLLAISVTLVISHSTLQARARWMNLSKPREETKALQQEADNLPPND